MATFRKTLISGQLQYNLVLYLDDLLLNNGYYSNVDVGETIYSGGDLSRLSPYGDSFEFPTGAAWQAPKSNWVMEGDIGVPSGITAPILPSGVVINSTFYPSNDPTYAHSYNYKKGLVIFNNTAPLSTDMVQVSYSYKDVFVDFINKKTSFALNNDYFGNDAIPDIVFPSGTVSTPAVLIDMSDHTIAPLQIGGGKKIFKTVHLHLISSDDHAEEISDISDLISYKEFGLVKLLDIDKLPERLTWDGDKASTYQEYTTMLADSTLFLNKAYIVRAEPVYLYTERENWNRIRIDLLLEVWDEKI